MANRLDIILGINDKATGKLNTFAGKAKKNWLAITAAIAGTTFAIKKLADATIAMNKALITTSSKVEDLQIRLKVLLKSAEKGNQVFEDMARLAGEVPKTYDEIMESATNLAGVVREGTKEINELMPIIVDMSAATGMSVQEVTGQIIRMYSAGAASADMFRERGISAALGFQAGVSYSAEETMRVITRQWEDGTGKFVGASDELAKSFTGMVSMLQDAWFQFKVDVGAELFEAVKVDLQVVLELIKESKEEGGKYNEVIEKLSKAFEDLHNAAKDFAVTAVAGGGQLVDAYNEVQVVVKGIQGAWLGFIAGIFQALDILARFPSIPGMSMGMLVDKETNRAALEAVKADILAVTQEINDARKAADKDYSESFRESMNDILAIFEEKKAEIEELRVLEDEGKRTSLMDYTEFERSLDLETLAAFQQSGDFRVEVVRNAHDKILAIKKAGAKKEMDTDKMVEQFFVGTQERGRKLYEKVKADQLGTLADTLESAAGLNKSFAVAAQAIAIGETIMYTSTGVMKALSKNDWVSAALIAAKGAVEVATISSQSFQSGTDLVPGQGGRTDPGEIVVPRTFAQAIREGRLTLGGEDSGEYGGRLGGGGGDIIINIYEPQVGEGDVGAFAEELGFEVERALKTARGF